MKNILHIIDTSGPGGAERVFIDVIQNLPAAEYRSWAVVKRPGWVMTELEKIGCEVHCIDNRGSVNFTYLKQLARLVDEHSIDLIHAHLLGSAVYASLTGLIKRVPIISTFHGMVDVDNERFLGAKLAIVDRLSAFTVSVSRALGDTLLTIHRLTPEKFRIIYNGIDPNRPCPQHTVRDELAPAPGSLLVGLLGNIRESKDYLTLLEVAARVGAQRSDIHFVIAGQGAGKLYDLLLARREALQLEERVTFLGFREDVDVVLAGVDIYLLTSKNEGFSISTLEAMAQGLPVLATRCGGPEEIITDGVDGLLVEKGDPNGIARALLNLCNDAALRDRLSSNGRKTVTERFSTDAMMKQYLTLYRELLG